jgi:hypothetical protein
MSGWFVAHLTPHAPGCERLPIAAPERWVRLHTASAPSGLETLLRQIGVGPADVTLRLQQLGDVALILSRPDRPKVPLAFIVEPSERELLEAHQFVSAHWRDQPERKIA